MQAYIQAIGTQIGVGLGSALRHVIILMNKLASLALKAATAFATFMQTIFGKYKGGASGIAMEGLGDAADYADDLSGSAGDAASGLGGAADAAKELKKDLSVLPFDELNQLNKDRDEASSGSGSGGSGGGGGVGGGGGLLDWGDLMDESALGKLPDAISAWAQQIKAAFEGQDWNLLGQIVARGLNEGLQKVYDLLDPQKAREKIFPWIDAFTTTFNSFVKWFDWDLLGRTVGRGLNDVISIIDRTITGIDWKALGSSFASGLNGLISEVDFRALGNMLGSKFMIIWDILNGFVHNFDWVELGSQLARGMSGFFERVNFSTIADTLATGLNGVFDALASFTSDFDWNGLVTNIANGINRFIIEFDWKGNGQKLGDFLIHLCDALIELVDTVNWEELGQGIADFLQQLPWRKLLYTAAHTLITVFGELLKGLASTPAGKFATALLGFIAAFQVGGRLLSFINRIGRAITGNESFSIVKGAIQRLLGNSVTKAASEQTVATATKTAGESVGKSFATAFSNFLTTGAGVALLEAGAIGATLVAAKKFSEAWDKSRGGNGVLTDFGTGLDDYMNKLTEAYQMSDETKDQLFLLKEEYENTGATASEAIQGIVDKMIELGVPMGAANELAEQMVGTGQGQEEIMRMIAEATGQAKEQIGEYNGTLGETSKTAQEANADFYEATQKLIEVKNAAGESSSEYQHVLDAFGRTMGAATTAGESYEMIKKIIEETGLSVDEFNKIISDEYGYAVGEVGESTEEAKKYYDELGTAAEAAEKRANQSNRNTGQSARDMAKDVTESVGSSTKSLQENSTQIEKTESTWTGKMSSMVANALKFAQETGKNMADSSKSVSDYESETKTSLDNSEKDFSNMSTKSIASMALMMLETVALKGSTKTMAEDVQTYVTGMSETFTTSIDTIRSGIDSMKTGMEESLSGISSAVSTAMESVHSTLANEADTLYTYGLNMGQSLANGFQSVHIPTPYLWVSLWEYMDLGDGGGMHIPHFSVGWYRSGGLFNGGKGQIIGVAEGGRDEAVLPLEDRRAMAKIGSAIANAGGNTGGMSDDMVDKLATRIAEIMIASQDNREQPMVYSELKVNDEVLARAVTRGQQKLDYRNNPTPRMAY